MPTEAAPAAGCHQHGAKAPARSPSSYRCCQIGHNQAVLQNPSVQTSLADPVWNASLKLAPVEASVHRDPGSATILSPDPPHMIPIRV